ncbi:class A beta-lactamase [Tenggerimyces flavus]|uniref:Beta-lactamase n=1 Tax=Tenggerimyces flavus TaxID=1708749 RepID=A0ABV7YPG8_9ACTN|nr:class A beta-lactamase [Tenggerimyces flavus]MBM7784962.1 beta-lactamase class A [Tenggerimyces flavus]
MQRRTRTVSRRSLLGAGFALPVAGLIPASQAAAARTTVRDIERQYGVRLGVYARNLATKRTLAHRAYERFAMCSTFKTLAASALLRDHDQHGEVLAKRITYTAADLVANSPITEQHVADGMTNRELCDAMLRFSDNTAANLVLRQLGGPRAITRFARSVGDCTSRLDRYETELNTAHPGDPRDTTTPNALAATYTKLLVGKALPAHDRATLKAWMLDNQTSGTRFRAALPEGWTLADKTGGGGYGSNNDAGIAYQPDGTPIVIVVMGRTFDPDATADNRPIVDVARLVFDRLG